MARLALHRYRGHRNGPRLEGRDSAHGRAGKRILLFAFAGLVIFTILFPETTSIAAQWLGIGRGTDLVFYLTSFAVMFLAALVYLKFKRLEDRLATLTTQLALSEFDRETAARSQARIDRWARYDVPAPS